MDTANTDSAHDLIRRLTSDDPSALDDAYRAHGSRCYSTAYAILRDATLAEDAVQEAFLSLWRHRHGLVARTAGVGPWLVVVSRNAALESLRRESRRAAREARVPESSPVEDPAAAVAAQAAAAEVRAALNELPDDQRIVIEYAYFRRRTMAEIAQATSTPLGTVKSRVRLALARLGSLLEPTTT